MKFLKDKTFNRAIKLTKGKRSRRQKTIANRHRASISLRNLQIIPDKENDRKWLVQSSTDPKRYYIVIMNEETCTNAG